MKTYEDIRRDTVYHAKAGALIGFALASYAILGAIAIDKIVSDGPNVEKPARVQKMENSVRHTGIGIMNKSTNSPCGPK